MSYLWVELYRPKKISDCILPHTVQRVLEGFVESKSFPNLILYGAPGIGKTTAARALCDELGFDTLFINGSNEGRFLDTVRNDVAQFASATSLSESKTKVVIFDEFDNTTSDVQLCLRGVIEEFSVNCRFIFTCNYINKVSDPIISRTQSIDFSFGHLEAKKLILHFFKSVKNILEIEGIEYEDKNDIVKVIKNTFPDFRRCLNLLQGSSNNGKIVFNEESEVDFDFSFFNQAIKAKDFNIIVTWVFNNTSLKADYVINKTYEEIRKSAKNTDHIAQASITAAKYLDYIAHGTDPQINLCAFFAELYGGMG